MIDFTISAINMFFVFLFHICLQFNGHDKTSLQYLYTIVHLNCSHWITLHMVTRCNSWRRLISRPVKITMLPNLRKYTCIQIFTYKYRSEHRYVHVYGIYIDQSHAQLKSQWLPIFVNIHNKCKYMQSIDYQYRHTLIADTHLTAI